MSYRDSWKERARSDEEARIGRFKQARKVAESAAKMLVERFGATRVYLFGSILDADTFLMHSDVDIAVEGLGADIYFRAVSCIADLASPGLKIDVVPLEDAYEYLKEKILREGVVLYEKESAHS